MNGLIGSLLGTINTDNKIQLSFDTPSLLRAGGIAIVAGVAIKAICKLLKL